MTNLEPQLKIELLQFNTDYIAAYNAGDAQALGELFTEDSIVMNTFGTLISGRSAIRAALERSFAGPSQGATIQNTPLHSKRLSDDVVVVQGTHRNTLNTDPPTSSAFNYTTVLLREGNAWKIAVAQFANIQTPFQTGPA